MTHEEILAKLEQFRIFDDAEPLHTLLVKVVELTGQVVSPTLSQNEIGYLYGWNDAMKKIKKTIEKELN